MWTCKSLHECSQEPFFRENWADTVPKQLSKMVRKLPNHGPAFGNIFLRLFLRRVWQHQELKSNCFNLCLVY